MSHILVTGGAGFIGSHLCEALVRQGHQVTCVDNLSSGSVDNLPHAPNVQFVLADVNRWEAFKKFDRHYYDAVFHYAATVGVRVTEENPERVLADVHGLHNIERLARAGKVGKVIYASSSEVYGSSQQQPLREDAGFAAWSPYTAVKMYGEHLFRALWEKTRVPAVSLRFFNVYGPRQRGSGYGFVAAQFIEQALSGQPLTVFGDGQQTRDFVYISDNVTAAIAALKSDVASGEIINIGTGRETSVLDLAKQVLRVTSADRKLAPRHLPGRKIEIRRRCADIAKMKSLLGITCSTSLEEGLRKTVAADQPAVTSRALSPVAA